MSKCKNAVALMGSLIMLAMLVSSASANRVSTSTQFIRGAWRAMTFGNPEVGINVSCPVTLEGSLHSRTISKTVGALMGYITRAVLAESQCTGGRARVLSESLPWHVRYQSFTGTLPNITGVNGVVEGATFGVEAGFFGVCLYRKTAANPGNVLLDRNAVTGVINSITISGTIPSISGGFCPQGTLGGTTTSVALLNSNTAVIVRLI